MSTARIKGGRRVGQGAGMADFTVLPQVFTRRQARAVGLSDRQLDRCLAKGDLIAVRRGILRRADQDADGDPPDAENYCKTAIFVAPPIAPEAVPLDLRAALLGSPSRQLVISHASAARLWGLPQPLGGWPQPQFSAVEGSNRSRRGMHVRVVRLDDDQIMEWNGLAVTTPERTLVDCLRSLPGRDGLAMIDSALHRGLVRAPDVLTVLAQQCGWPGAGLARQVLGLADARRESPLESWSTWAFAHSDLPLPEYQVEIRASDGRRMGRVDFWWRRGGLVGEADGRAKYALAAAERGGNAEALLDVLQGERRREQRLREVGAEVIRWSTRDVLDRAAADALAARIRSMLELGRQREAFTGVVVPAPSPVATVSSITTAGIGG